MTGKTVFNNSDAADAADAAAPAGDAAAAAAADAAVAAAGDAAPAGDAAGDAAAAGWLKDAGLDEAQTAFVGDRSISDLVKFASERDAAASARADEVAAAKGMIQPPQDDATPEQAKEYFDQFKPKEVGEYASHAGLQPDKLDGFQKIDIEAAHEAGIHKDQFKALFQARAEKQADADKAHGVELVDALKAKWGADYEANGTAVDRFMKSAGMPEGLNDALSAPGSRFTTEHFVAIAEMFLLNSKVTREGTAPGGLNENTGQSATEERQALYEKNDDPKQTFTDADKRRMAELNMIIADEKSAAQAET